MPINMYEKPIFNDVISFDSNKVYAVVINGEDCVAKKTSIAEYDNYCHARHMVDKKRIKLLVNKVSYELRILPVIWNDAEGLLISKHIKGNNLEIIMRHNKTHCFGVTILLELLQVVKKHSFFWLDFAPRNIIVSLQEKSIYLLDFEKGFLEKKIWNDYLSLIIEEVSIFLLPQENPYIEALPKLINDNNKTLKRLLLDRSNRIQTLFKSLEQGDNTITLSLVYLKIITLSLPYLSDNQIVYPVIKLEYILNVYGYDLWGFYILNVAEKEKQKCLNRI